MKRALITGVTGQDGSYLSEMLLAKGYEVHGVIRRASVFNTGRIEHLYRDPHDAAPADGSLFLHYGDVLDGARLSHLVNEIRPHEVYNLAAQSHVKVAFEQPEYTSDVAALGALRVLEACRQYSPGQAPVRIYQAGSSEMFGGTAAPQNENTPFYPRSPYAVSKVAAHWYAVNYREAYGMFVCNGILFNHESPRRGETFVTRKITRAAARIALGLQDRLYLGNLNAVRDWGFAGDYVEAMWLMLQQDAADDYVIATGESHSVEEFLDAAFGALNLDWRRHVVIDPAYYRPTEVHHLQGDAAKAHDQLGWEPKVSFEALVRMMIDADVCRAQRDRLLAAEGHGLKGELLR